MRTVAGVVPDVLVTALESMDVESKALKERACVHLREAATASDWRIRSGAVQSLGRLRDAGALPILIAALRDDYAEVDGGGYEFKTIYPVRLVAARALGRIGDPKAVPALVRAMKDPGNDWARVYTQSINARTEAVRALRAIGTREALKAIAGSPTPEANRAGRDKRPSRPDPPGGIPAHVFTGDGHLAFDEAAGLLEAERRVGDHALDRPVRGRDGRGAAHLEAPGHLGLGLRQGQRDAAPADRPAIPRPLPDPGQVEDPGRHRGRRGSAGEEHEDHPQDGKPDAGPWAGRPAPVPERACPRQASSPSAGGGPGGGSPTIP